MSPPLPPSLTVSTDNRSKKETSSSSILVVVLLMYPSSPLRKVSSRSRLPTVTPILEEKISITRWSTTAWLTSRRKLASTSPRTTDHSEDLEPSARRPREFCLVHIRPQLNVKLSLKVRTTTTISPEPS